MVVDELIFSSKMDGRKSKAGGGEFSTGSILPNKQLLFMNRGYHDGWYFELSLLVILGIIVIVVFLTLKLLGACDEAEEENRTLAGRNERSHLLPEKKSFRLPYGTDEEDDELVVGSGTCSSSEDLYDARLCVICYEMPRNRFFVPCGHCSTCRDCSKRIMVENRICPICRSVIGKVRKLLLP